MSQDAEFPTGIRGYDREIVDEAVRVLKRDLLQISNQNSQLILELREKTQLAEQLEQQVAESLSPNYASVGARAALILSTAEDQALRIVEDAETERASILAGVEGETEELKAEAKGYYDSLVAEAGRRAERIQATAKADYEALIAEARTEAARLVDEATREAGAIRGAIATEAAKIRATAKREAESLKTRVERELSERKLVATRTLTKNLDPEAALALVSEQARGDLNLELTARRQEAEAEYLRKHQEAVAATQGYLNEANAMLLNARTRAEAARLESETLEAAAKSVNKRTRDEARAAAEATLVAADEEVRSILEKAHADAAALLRRAENQLRKLELEKGAVGAYLKNLAAVVAEAENSISGD